jgi:hypothetical protein
LFELPLKSGCAPESGFSLSEAFDSWTGDSQLDETPFFANRSHLP